MLQISDRRTLRQALMLGASILALAAGTARADGPSFEDRGAGEPEKKVGKALDTISANPPASLTSFFTALNGLSTNAQVSSALDSAGVAGEGYSGLASAMSRTGELVSGAIGEQMFASHPHAAEGEHHAALGGMRMQLASVDPSMQLGQAHGHEGHESMSPWSVWASGFGQFGSIQGKAGESHTLNYSGGGGLFGADYRLQPGLLLGGFAGYAGAGTSVSSLSGSGSVDTALFGAYASWTGGRTYVDALAGYGSNDLSLRRTVAFPGFSSAVTGNTHADQFLGMVELGRSYDVLPAFALVPFVNFFATNIDQDAFNESSAVGLHVNGRNTLTFSSTLGSRFEKEYELGEGRALTLTAKLGWGHDLLDSKRLVTANFAASSLAGFTATGADPKADRAVVSAGVVGTLNERTKLYVHYDGAINGHDDVHAVIGGVRWSW